MLAPLLMMAALLPAADPPISLHPDNPHYFHFRGKPTFLIGSTEHYGAVLNLDFDSGPYLDELHARGLNLTRTFSGTYREVPGSFKIRDNTLAPQPGRFACPWARKGDKFDLDAFDEAYFRRLKEFITEAGKRGVVVEYVLFCPLYEENLWDVSPMNAKNNVNGVGACPRNEALTLKHADLVAKQVAFVKKAVGELKVFDNLYYEICNEPYFGGVTLDWQARIAEAIVEAEKDLPHKHLIAQNIANGKAKIEHPNPAVSLFNFHYATPPDTVALNYGLNKALSDDETGFRGTGDNVYRTEAWEFFLAGGSAYDNLDYSFTPDHEDGTAKVEDPTPGGGGRTFREQLSTLKRFLEGFHFLRLRPDASVVVGGAPSGVTPRVLAEKGRQYAIYLKGGKRAKLELDLPASADGYEGAWLDPVAGKVTSFTLRHEGGRAVLETPEFAEDIAVSLKARNSIRGGVGQ